MIFDFIKRLQSRPEGQKRSIAFGLSLFLSSIVFVMWISLFQLNVARDNAVLAEKDIPAEVSPFQVLKNNVAGAFAGLRQVMGNASGATSTSSYTASEESSSGGLEVIKVED
ncbi:MAG: hypothetical protein A2836_03535 [Candidatus Taylorbacteria bacterium RIFCSPHIGHO2_01_FULL_45_63]|nr:MAG: hypothetical protein A2836_03535 [Candidatus Taylorbacteria bacterium RIFCSPHIGHO2_01_FULL_45_63]OHA32467.1 MAG: hypothetical protein A3A22_01540 [Candidatus Taylorbacteria bacterium RIFCSPLOWO2_01_FULL_45_34b]